LVDLAKQFQRRTFFKIDQLKTKIALAIIVSDWLISKESSPL
jgi:hypothetical protein